MRGRGGRDGERGRDGVRGKRRGGMVRGGRGMV